MNDEQRILELLGHHQQTGLYSHYYAECGLTHQRHETNMPLTWSSLPDGKTVFDLASLTKALVITPLFARLFQQSSLNLETPIGQMNSNCQNYFAPFVDIANITIGDLLAHRSGLPAWRNFWICRLSFDETKTLKKTSHDYVAKTLERLYWQPKNMGLDVYSDVGYIILGVAYWVVECNQSAFYWTSAE